MARTWWRNEGKGDADAGNAGQGTGERQNVAAAKGGRPPGSAFLETAVV